MISSRTAHIEKWRIQNTNPFGQGLNTQLKLAINGVIDVRSAITFKGLVITGGIEIRQISASFTYNITNLDQQSAVELTNPIYLPMVVR